VREALLHHSVEGELLVIRDGDAAIRYVENIESTERCPDLVIVDLNLPKRPGREVLERMRQHPCFRHATVAIFSSSNAEQDRALAFGFRVSRYIRKPLRLDDFLNLGAVFKALLTA
jgi:CheY-like chemotaxis protein